MNTTTTTTTTTVTANDTTVIKTLIVTTITNGNNEKGCEYVDLGLPSGIKWAKCNVGAEKETDYGKYFQWGDTVGYTGDEALNHSTWSTCPFNNGSSSYDSTYFESKVEEICPKTEEFTKDGTTYQTRILDLKYDGVRANMGGKWRMPTVNELYELYTNTNHEWVDDFNGSGVNGMKFTNKSDSSKYIFIPAAGYIDNGSFEGVGYICHIWSSSILTVCITLGWFFCTDDTFCGTLVGHRFYGFNLRGVME